jgi:hypothetical protein
VPIGLLLLEGIASGLIGLRKIASSADVALIEELLLGGVFPVDGASKEGDILPVERGSFRIIHILAVKAFRVARKVNLSTA